LTGKVLPELKTTMEDLQSCLEEYRRHPGWQRRAGAAGDADALQEVRRAAQAISGLVDYLERNPEALVRGKTQEKSK